MLVISDTYSLKQWFTNPAAHQNNLECLYKAQVPRPHSRNSDVVSVVEPVHLTVEMLCVTLMHTKFCMAKIWEETHSLPILVT